MTSQNPAYAQIGVIYRFCAQSMRYPTSQWFTDSYLQILYDFLRTLGGTKEIETLQQQIATAANALEPLQVEYTRLFINGIPHVVAPMYAGVYIDKTLRGKFSEEILTYYGKCGYTLSNSGDLPDNLVHQLEFLSFLAEDGDQAAEEEFLRRFFLRWFPVFASRIKEEAVHPFYPVIVSIIDFFTKEEEEYGV